MDILNTLTVYVARLLIGVFCFLVVASLFMVTWLFFKDLFNQTFGTCIP